MSLTIVLGIAAILSLIALTLVIRNMGKIVDKEIKRMEKISENIK